jgi:hypothetical protein
LEMGSCKLFTLADLKLWSFWPQGGQVAWITGVSHQCLALLWVLTNV